MSNLLNDLTCEAYISCMEQIHENEKSLGKKKHVCQTAEANYQLSETRRNLNIRISFRDIVLLAIKYDKTILEHKHIEKISYSLKKICKHKLFNDQRQHPFLHAMFIIADCFKNLLGGYGFKTTPSLALDLIEKWSTTVEQMPKNVSPSIETACKEVSNPPPIKPTEKVKEVKTGPEKAKLKKISSSQPSERVSITQKRELSVKAIPPAPTHEELKSNGRAGRINPDNKSVAAANPTPPKLAQDTISSTSKDARVVSKLTATWEDRKKVVDFVPPRSSDIPVVSRESNLKKAIESFKHDPVNCQEWDKNIVFMNLTTIGQVIQLMNEITSEGELKIHMDGIVSHLNDHKALKQYLEALKLLKEKGDLKNAQLITLITEVELILSRMHKEKEMINLEILYHILKDFDSDNEYYLQIIFSVFRCCKKEVAKDLAIILSKKTTFDLRFLTQCFDIYIDKNKNEGVNDFTLFILETLVKIYDIHYLNNPHSQENPPHVPVNHPSVVGAFSILLESKYNNDDHVREYLSRLMQKKEFDQATKRALLSVFEKKQDNCVYLAKEMLLNYTYWE